MNFVLVNSGKQTLELGNFGRSLIAKRLGNPALNRAESCVSFVTKLVTSKTVGGIVSCQTQKPQNQASLSLICTKRSPFFCSNFLCPQGQNQSFFGPKSDTYFTPLPLSLSGTKTLKT